MVQLYTLLYIDMEFPENTEIYGTFRSLDAAIKALITRSGYIVTPTGELIQFGLKQPDFSSFDQLYKHIEREMCLIDDENDIYKIVLSDISV